jgi:hypothetical protein
VPTSTPTRSDRREQVDRIVSLAMKNKPSFDFCGYWQRHQILWVELNFLTSISNDEFFHPLALYPLKWPCEMEERYGSRN